MWNVNATAHGGGVAEMLQTLLAYVRGVGVDTQWWVLTGSPDFFVVTKRMHNVLHGEPGDGGPWEPPSTPCSRRHCDRTSTTWRRW